MAKEKFQTLGTFKFKEIYKKRNMKQKKFLCLVLKGKGSVVRSEAL
jgi:hypothetical protein